MDSSKPLMWHVNGMTPMDGEHFSEFCRQYRNLLDESFISDEELSGFTANEENPTWLLYEDKMLMGTSSLMLDDYHLRGGRARFRILYCNNPTPDAYAALLNPLREQVADLNKNRQADGLPRISHWFVFTREENTAQRACLEANGFRTYRTSHILIRPELPVSEVSLPLDMAIRTFRFGQDEQDYCRIRNAAFKGLLGSETPLLPADVAKLALEGDALPGGIFFLVHGEVPVGVVRVSRDSDDAVHGDLANIGPLALLPEYQGKRLGTMLLRHALRFGCDRGLSKAVLSVNAENAPALGLYLREGFFVEQGYICMREDFR